MTELPPADERDPFFQWLILRLEQSASHEAREPSPGHRSSAESILLDIERAERCANALAAIWPDIDPGMDSTSDASIDAVPLDGRSNNSHLSDLGSLGRFQIQRLLGRGGMGNVFLAFDPTLQRPVALKVPRFDVAGDPLLRERFLIEARSAAKLSHPNLVEVYDAGLDGSICFIASAYCDGPDLENWLASQDHPVEPKLAAGLVERVAQAIHYCHEMGIVHRDLKPANILLASATDDQIAAQRGMPFTPKITDFGLARVIEERLSQTRSSLIVGTPLYMAPEQADGRTDAVGPATDIFALGVILYELLTGRPPFEGRTALTVLSRIQREEPVSPTRVHRQVPAGLEAICMRCLRKLPEERYKSAGALAADLKKWQNGGRISARRFTLWDRFRTWSRQSERLRDAGLAAIGWNGAIFLILMVLVFNYVFGIETPLPSSGSDLLVLECLIGSGMHGFFCWVGWRTIRGDRWAYWVGFAGALFICLLAANALMGGYSIFSIYDDFLVAKFLIMLVFTVLSAIQLLAFLVAMLASTPEL